MIVYPNPASWDEFCPSEIFIAASAEEQEAAIYVIQRANIGATIALGEGTKKTTIYKKVGEIKDIADINSALVLVGVVTQNVGN